MYTNEKAVKIVVLHASANFEHLQKISTMINFSEGTNAGLCSTGWTGAMDCWTDIFWFLHIVLVN